jgi:hypothetical protein
MSVMDELGPELVVPWAVLDFETGRLVCKRCGVSEPQPPGGIVLNQYADVLNGFAKRHELCEESA